MADNSSLPDRSYKRSFHHKTRHGCITCKARRVKCDQGQPHCQVCIKARKVCEGYTPEDQLVVRRPEVPNWRFRNSFAPDSANYTGQSSLAQHRWMAPLDPQAMMLSLQPTAAQSCSFVPSSFWCSRLAQVAEYAASVKHGLLALDVWRQKADAPECPDDGPGPLFLYHYGSALRLQASTLDQKALDAESVVVALLTCLLLVVLESVQGKRAELLLHLRNGILLGRRYDIKGTFQGDVSLIKFLLARYGLSHAILDTPHTLESVYNLDDRLLDVETDEVKQFSGGAMSLDSFMTTMHNLENDIYRYAFTSLMSGYEDRKEKQDEDRKALMRRSYSWFARMNAASPPNTPGKRLLMAQHEMGRILLNCTHTKSHLPYDEYVPAFKNIVDLMDSALPQEVDRREEWDSSRHIFAVDMATQAFLFLTARLCRDRTQRRRAVELMRRAPKREGAWQACETIAAANAIIEFEELGTPTTEDSSMTISETQRVVLVRFERRGDDLLDIELHTRTATGRPHSQRFRNQIHISAYQHTTAGSLETS